MATLSLKPNARKTAPLPIPKPSQGEWIFKDTGLMVHESGFSIQFFNGEECEIINIPKDMALSSIRELSDKAMKARSRRFG